MNYENLRILRNILLRSFVVGLAIVVVLGLATLNWWTMWIELTSKWFSTDAATLTPLVIKFFLNIRFFLLFVVLTPALAIHWTLKKDMKRKK